MRSGTPDGWDAEYATRDLPWVARGGIRVEVRGRVYGEVCGGRVAEQAARHAVRYAGDMRRHAARHAAGHAGGMRGHAVRHAAWGRTLERAGDAPVYRCHRGTSNFDVPQRRG